MGVTSRLLLLGRKLPSLGRLAWLRSPNAPDSKYSLPISCFAAVGVGPFFSDATTPIPLTMAEILAVPGINEYHILASLTKGVVVYDPYTTPDVTLSRAHRYIKHTLDVRPTIHYNGAMSKEEIIAAGGTYTGGIVYAADPDGELRTPGADRPAVEGLRLDGTTYYDTNLDGTPIIPYTNVQTRTGNADFSAFTDSTTVKDYTQESPLTAPMWLCQPARTNYALQSATPATHTTGSVPIGTYCLWCEGGTSVTATAGTAVGTFGAATPGTPKTITITTAGTVVLTVAGAVTWVQLENGAFKTSRIYTTTASSTRAATVKSFPTLGKIRSNNIAFLLTCVPRDTITSIQRLFSCYTDATNRFGLYIEGGIVGFITVVGGVVFGLANAIILTEMVPIEIICTKSSSGMKLSNRIFVNGNWSSWSSVTSNTTSIATSNWNVPSVYQLGSQNSIEQFTGNISELKTKLIPDGITDPLAWAKKEFGV